MFHYLAVTVLVYYLFGSREIESMRDLQFDLNSVFDEEKQLQNNSFSEKNRNCYEFVEVSSLCFDRLN